MIRDYELTFIAKPDLDVTNMTALVERVKGIIAEVSGDMHGDIEVVQIVCVTPAATG